MIPTLVYAYRPNRVVVDVVAVELLTAARRPAVVRVSVVAVVFVVDGRLGGATAKQSATLNGMNGTTERIKKSTA